MTARTGAVVLLAAALSVADVAPARACGERSPCLVDGGHYRVALPPGEMRGALVFFHGYNASAESQMRHASLVAVAHARGLAFVAPDGAGRSWAHRGSPHAARPGARDEIAFVGAVLDDLEARFDLAPGAIVAGGFSQGASMGFDVACVLAPRIAGLATISGVFWEPLRTPAECLTPAPPHVHVHGTADGVFPLEGRPIGERFRQGATRESLAVLRARADCGEPVAESLDGLACEVAACARGESLLCLHPGGHGIDATHLAIALDRLAGAR